MKNSPLIHPLLFAFFPIIFIFSQNIAEANLSAICRPLVVVIALTLLLLAVSRLVVRSWRKGGIIISLLLLLFFSYGHFTSTFQKLTIDIKIINLCADELFLIFFSLIFLIGSYLIIKRGKKLKKLTTALNVIAAILVAIQIMQVSYALATRPAASDLQEKALETLQIPEKPPDIYFIVLDGYGRHDILKDIYNYDNSDFLGYLQNKGFHIVRESNSNYSQTALSLAATLNLDYVPQLGTFDPRSHDHALIGKFVQNNYLFRLLKKHEYKLAAFATGYADTEFKDADYYYSPGFTLSEFENILLNTTPVPLILKNFISQFDLHRKRIEFVLNKLPTIECESSPLFVFAHIIAPHPPFVIDMNGGPVDRDTPFSFHDGSHYYLHCGTKEEYLAGYWHQVTYITRRMQEVVEGILSRYDDNPPIIIIQGDHGPGSRHDWQFFKKTYVKERFAILSAFYLPGIDHNLIDDHITPVNNFRLILNKYFGANYKRLPDKSFYSYWAYPYFFIDVTQRLSSGHSN